MFGVYGFFLPVNQTISGVPNLLSYLRGAYGENTGRIVSHNWEWTPPYSTDNSWLGSIFDAVLHISHTSYMEFQVLIQVALVFNAILHTQNKLILYPDVLYGYIFNN